MPKPTETAVPADPAAPPASDENALPPIRLTVPVPLAPERAFHLFTAELASWWPLTSHSLGGAEAVSCAIEPRIGGRVFERRRDGREDPWGRIVIWDPPRRLAFTWHPGRPEDTAQTVEVTFLPAREGTRVELEHRGWEAYGEGAEAMREQYVPGWGAVLGDAFRAAAERAAAT